MRIVLWPREFVFLGWWQTCRWSLMLVWIIFFWAGDISKEGWLMRSTGCYFDNWMYLNCKRLDSLVSTLVTKEKYKIVWLPHMWMQILFDISSLGLMPSIASYETKGILHVCLWMSCIASSGHELVPVQIWRRGNFGLVVSSLLQTQRPRCIV